MFVLVFFSFFTLSEYAVSMRNEASLAQSGSDNRKSSILSIDIYNKHDRCCMVRCFDCSGEKLACFSFANLNSIRHLEDTRLGRKYEKFLKFGSASHRYEVT